MSRRWKCCHTTERNDELALASFDHLISAGEERWRDRDAESFGGLEIDHELEGRWLFHGQVGGTFAFEEAVHIRGCASPSITIGIEEV